MAISESDRVRIRARHHRDQADAQVVQAIRELGPATGRTRHYQRQAERAERERGY